MTRQHDQQGTPFTQNVADLWAAIKGAPRTDGRNRVMAILHESKNVVTEIIRAHSSIAANVVLALLLLLVVCHCSHQPANNEVGTVFIDEDLE